MNRELPSELPRNNRSNGWRSVLLALSLALMLAPRWMRSAPAQAAVLPLCFAEINGDNTTDYSSGDAAALRSAVLSATAGSVVKIAGTCAGVTYDGSLAYVVGVNKPLTLRGGYTTTNWLAAPNAVANPTILDGEWAGRVITATTAITIENLTVRNGWGSYSNAQDVRGYGGGVLASTSVMISNSTFFNNRADGLTSPTSDKGGAVASMGSARIVASTFISNGAGLGGALYTVGAADLVNTDFISNVAGSSSNGGGAVSITGGSIVGGVFRENRAASDGGALNVSILRTFAISGTQFLSNTTTGTWLGGGGAYFGRTTGVATLWMTNTTFISNTSGGPGGGMVMDEYVDFVIDGGRFERNVARSSSDGKGGAIYSNGVLSTTARIRNSVFEDNATLSHGGAIYVETGDADTLPVEAAVELVNTRFVSNTAGYLDSFYRTGGAVYLNRRAMVTDSVFIGNHAGTAGAAYFAGSASLANTDFITNYTINDNGGVGGGAYLAIGGSIVGGVFRENNGRVYGGGLYAKLYADLTISGTQFLSNTANSAGSAHITYGNYGQTVYITNTDFISSTTVTGGGALFIDSYTDFVIRGSRFVRNTTLNPTYGKGGALTSYGTLSATARIEDSLFESNFAGAYGGALMAWEGNNGSVDVPLEIVNTEFLSNTAGASGGDDYGGAVYSKRTTLITDSTFTANSAGVGGGAYFEAATQLANTDFVANASTKAASGHGGGAYFYAGGGIIGGRFQKNAAAAYGGGVYASLRADITISGTQFQTNTAVTDGGGVYAALSTNNQTIFITNSDFVSNTVANAGGGVFVDNYVDFRIDGGRFQRNVAGYIGGALSSYGYMSVTAHIENAAFDGNAAGTDGGAIYINGDSAGAVDVPLALMNAEFTSNTAGSRGGAVYAEHAVLAASSAFTANTAATAGGGVHVAAGLDVSGSTFIGNVAPNGAAVNEGGITSTVANSIFMSNTASSRGGAYKTSGVGPLAMTGNRFEGNSAEKGGALYLGSDGSAALTNNVFAGNEASTGGADAWLGLYNFAAQQNTFVAKTAGGGEAVRNAMTTGSATLTNSVFADYGVGVSTSGAVGAELNGVLWDGVTTPTSGTATVNGAVTGSAGFANAAVGNYLAQGAARDAGVDSGVAADIRGFQRPYGDGYDLGAYEAGDTRLSALAIHPGALAPAFVSSTTRYTAEVPEGTTSVVVTATAHDVSATVAYASSAGSCTAANCTITGPKTWITVTVTAANGDQQEYFLEITLVGQTVSTDATLGGLAIHPGALAPAFVSSTTSYTAHVPYGTTSMAVTATVNDVSATVTYASSAGSCAAANCAVAAPKTWITVTVTAASGDQQEYYIEIDVAEPGASTDAALSDLAIAPGVLTPAFVSSTTDYAAGVPNGTTSTAVTAVANDAGATVTYASSAGDCAAPPTRGAVVPAYTCAVAGPKTWITVTVTAASGDQQEYHIEITVAAPLTTIDRVWPGTGLPEGGMPVRIFGSGFAVALTVTIDGASVPFTIENDGRILFVMPPGTAGQRVSVTVQTADSSQTAANAFTYVQPDVLEVDGATGGVFTTTDGVIVTVPPQGVSGMFVITMTPLPPADGVPGNVLMYSFRLDAMLNWIPLASLTNPVTIRLPVDEGIFAIADGERPWLYSWTADGGRPTAAKPMTDDRRQTTVDGGRRSAVGGRWILVHGQQYDPGTKVMTVALRPMGVYALSTAYVREYWFPVVPTLR